MSTGTACIAAAVVGAIVIAIPTPPTSSPGRVSQKVELWSSWAKITSEPATSAIPTAISQREPNAVASLPAIGATRTMQQRHRQERRAGLRRRVAEDVLHVERDEEEDAEHRERDEEHRPTFAPANVALRKSEMSSIGTPLVQLEQHEGDETDRGDSERGRGFAATSSRTLFASISA